MPRPATEAAPCADLALLRDARPAPPPHGSLLAALEAAARTAAPLFTLHLGSKRVRQSAATLLEGARRYGLLLQQHGVGPGDRVPILLPTSADFIQAFMGTMLIGAVPAPLASPMTFGALDRYLDNIAGIVEDADARCMVVSDRVLRSLAKAPRLQGCLDHALTPADLDGLGPGPLKLPSIDEEATALLQYTSGTTGRPKGVMISHRALVANTYAIAEGLRLGPSDVGVSWLPMFHDMGLIGVLCTAICHPYPVHLIAPEQFIMRPGRWLSLIGEVGGTISAAPNFAYELCVSRIQDVNDLKLHSWRAALNGAEAVHSTTLERFEEHFGPAGFDARAAAPVYGMAENTLAATFPKIGSPVRTMRVDREALDVRGDVRPTNTPQARAIVSVGTPVAGTSIGIADVNGETTAPGRVGEIRVSGPSLMSGYFRNPKASDAAVSDGWLLTGDLGFVQEGQLFITGRARDLIIQGGRNLYPEDVERVAVEAVGLSYGVAAFARPNSRRGTDELIVVAESRERDPAGRSQLVKEIRGALLATLGAKAEEVHLCGVGSIPRTTSGKIRRRECARLLEELLGDAS